MKPVLQLALLRLLDDWTVRPTGGGRPRTEDALLIAAANVDVDQAMPSGRFRSGLYCEVVTV